MFQTTRRLSIIGLGQHLDWRPFGSTLCCWHGFGYWVHLYASEQCQIPAPQVKVKIQMQHYRTAKNAETVRYKVSTLNCVTHFFYQKEFCQHKNVKGLVIISNLFSISTTFQQSSQLVLQNFAISVKRFQFMHNSARVVSFNAYDCRVKLLNTIGQESSQLSSFKMQAQYKQ